MTSPLERIQRLENIEKDIASVLQYSGQALAELSKDKPANKQVEGHVQQFLKTLTNVETELSKQINYLTQVSTGQAHEGSNYNSQKILQMTWHRLEHIRSEVNELEKLKTSQRNRLPQQPQMPNQQQPSQQQPYQHVQHFQMQQQQSHQQSSS